MGFPIARRLAQAGFALSAYDPAGDKGASLSAAEPSVAVAVDPSSLAAQADVIITCLPDEQAIELTFLSRRHCAPKTSSPRRDDNRSFDLFS